MGYLWLVSIFSGSWHRSALSQFVEQTDNKQQWQKLNKQGYIDEQGGKKQK